MTTAAPESTRLHKDEQLRDALISYWRLSDKDVTRIQETMRDKQIQFGEAALICGAITQREFHEAYAWVQRAATQPSGSLVETALRRLQHRNVPTLHSVKIRPGPQLVLVQDPYNPRSERLRALRTELLLINEGQREASVVALVSPSAGEGRTLLAAELAFAFAQLGRRTLLVDADFRRPSLHALFGADNTWGLAQALAFAEPPRPLSVEDTPQLFVLTSGAIPPNPLELLSDGRFGRLLSEWRRSFEFIFVDTPPISQYSDGLAIATMAGRALVLSRAASTAHRDMKEMLRRLGNTKARILGAIINHF